MKSKIVEVKSFYNYLTHQLPAITEFSIFLGHPNAHAPFMNHKWIMRVESVLTCARGVYSHACAEAYTASQNHRSNKRKTHTAALTKKKLSKIVPGTIYYKKNRYKKELFPPSSSNSQYILCSLPLILSIYCVNIEGNVINL